MCIPEIRSVLNITEHARSKYHQNQRNHKQIKIYKDKIQKKNE